MFRYCVAVIALLFNTLLNVKYGELQLTNNIDTKTTISLPHAKKFFKSAGVIAGNAPSLVLNGEKIYMAFASGDSIFCVYSTDGGRLFSAPVLAGVLKGLVNAGGRGPQLVTSNGWLLIAAPCESGDLYTWLKQDDQAAWKKGPLINDVPGTVKECFVSLAAGHKGHLFATWLDLRIGKKNNVFGAESIDGGKTWKKNKQLYKSPEGAVCECCKPSVAMKNNHVAVMFRNNLGGNRDMYLVQSLDGGATFGSAFKMGDSSWKLNGCPMDGGSVMIDDKDIVRTAWRKEANVYTCEPGKREEFVSKGRQGVIAALNHTTFIVFTNEGRVRCRRPDGRIADLGPGGSYPKLIATGKMTMLCAWEFENNIHTALVPE